MLAKVDPGSTVLSFSFGSAIIMVMAIVIAAGISVFARGAIVPDNVPLPPSGV